jgi:hypothetical protein
MLTGAGGSAESAAPITAPSHTSMNTPGLRMV